MAFIVMQVNAILAIILGSAITAFIQGVYATTAT
jgi:tetrahydromethanopterin S-methyltransferase subunit E